MPTFDLPKTRFAETNGLADQVHHILSEAEEIWDEILYNEGLDGGDLTERLEDKIFDLFQSSETLQHVMLRTLGADRYHAIIARGIQRLTERGYYASESI